MTTREWLEWYYDQHVPVTAFPYMPGLIETDREKLWIVRRNLSEIHRAFWLLERGTYGDHFSKHGHSFVFFAGAEVVSRYASVFEARGDWAVDPFPIVECDDCSWRVSYSSSSEFTVYCGGDKLFAYAPQEHPDIRKVLPKCTVISEAGDRVSGSTSVPNLGAVSRIAVDRLLKELPSRVEIRVRLYRL